MTYNVFGGMLNPTLDCRLKLDRETTIKGTTEPVTEYLNTYVVVCLYGFVCV